MDAKIEVDARGFSCPIPVMKAQKAIEQNPGKEINVLVDNGAAKDNVTRLGKSRGYLVKVENASGDFKLVLTPTS